MTGTTFAATWDLQSLFPSPGTPEFQSVLSAFEGELAQVAEASVGLPALSTDATASECWDGFLQRAMAVETRGADLRAYIECLSAADAANRTYQELDARLTALLPLRDKVATNLELAFREVSEAAFEEFIGASEYRRSLASALRFKRQLATLRLERDAELLASELSVSGLHAWSRLYDRLSGNLRVTYTEAGETVTRSVGQVQLDAPERSLRKQRFAAVDAAWATIADPCSMAINHLAGWRQTLYRRQGRRDHLDAPLLLNRMQRATLETMWSVVDAHRAVLVDYLSLKARLLGLERLTWVDVHAPLPEIPGAGATASISYDDACRSIIESFDRFSPRLGDFARMSLEQGWIEAEDRSGKRQGGFCTSLYGAKQSRIFMTYTGTADSMSTLAHELGHAYHSWVLRDEPYWSADYPMNLAETASTFAEAVLGETRLAQATSAYDRLGMLEGMMSDSAAFLMNIRARFLFEDRFYHQRAQGEVGPDQLNELMSRAQIEAYGGVLDEAGTNPRFWVSKLHFYIGSVPFYNFPYTFGYLLSLALYQLAKTTGDFPDQYDRFLLETGRSDAETAVRSSFGYDLTKPDLWELSIQAITERGAQFRAAATEWLATVGRSEPSC